ncbi:hypothetical protein WG66_016227 [Moniliophthora roreri]|uniref:Uncharacterized protein n=1 Tax=Moniliophthora roreri TaxID=221103 RepID=A0A0W0FF60_MONRR|nr:hypothetical protein WG66_016227 [Moniliophthora roreri]
MQKCYQLGRLQKSQNVFKSILYFRQTPGDAFGAHLNIPGRTILDPSHPAANLPRNLLPSFRDPQRNLTLTVVPFGLLAKHDFPRLPPTNVPFETWDERVARSMESQRKELAPVKLEKWQKPGRLPISTIVVVPKKTTSKRKVVRGRISSRLKTAMELVLLRNAHVKDGKLVFDEARNGNVDVLRGWTYSFLPSLEVNLMPYTKLIPLVREAMLFVHKKASAMEKRWADQSMKTWKPKQKQVSVTTPGEVASISDPLPDQAQPSTISSRSRRQTHTPPPVAVSGNDMDIFKDMGIAPATRVSTTPPVAIPEDVFSDVDTSAQEDEKETWTTDVTPEPELLERGSLSSAPSLASQLNLSPIKPKSKPTSPPPSRERWGYAPLSSISDTSSDSEWVKAYGNVHDMAKRKMFYSKPIILEAGSKDRKGRPTKMTVEDGERREHEDRKKQDKKRPWPLRRDRTVSQK